MNALAAYVALSVASGDDSGARRWLEAHRAEVNIAIQTVLASAHPHPDYRGSEYMNYVWWVRFYAPPAARAAVLAQYPNLLDEVIRPKVEAPMPAWVTPPPTTDEDRRQMAEDERAYGRAMRREARMETPTPHELKTPNVYQLAVLRTIADAGGRVEPEAGGYWRTPDRRPFPPLPSARPGSKPYDWVSSNTVYSLVKKGLLARTHEASDYYRDPCVLTDAARALFRPPPSPPAGDVGWQLVDDGDWAIWRKRMGSQTFWAIARRTDGQVWTDRNTLSRSYPKLADAQAARANIDESIL